MLARAGPLQDDERISLVQRRTLHHILDVEAMSGSVAACTAALERVTYLLSLTEPAPSGALLPTLQSAKALITRLCMRTSQVTDTLARPFLRPVGVSTLTPYVA